MVRLSVLRLGVSRKFVALLLLSVILSSGALFISLREEPFRVWWGRRRVVGVLRVEGAILTSRASQRVVEAINLALMNESVRGVVVLIDSPGGTVEDVERIYLDLLRLGEEKPVVASVSMALSGGYYIAVAADYIYALPTSMVGNIGVIGVGPPVLIPSERVLESGAYKVTGFSRLLFPFNLTEALENFVSAVEERRGGRLGISARELMRAKVYLGSEAARLGLVDELGSLQNAIERVAEEGGLVRYEVVDLLRLAEGAELTLGVYNETGVRSWRELDVEYLRSLHPPPRIYYLYLPERGFQILEGEGEEGVGVLEEVRGSVIVDLSHGNRVSRWSLNVLVGELVRRGVSVGFLSQWDRVESWLENATCLIVAAPIREYSWEEGKAIEEFVERGGLLLLLYDPSAEFLALPGLNGPMNSLANRFGIGFANGYLYDEESFYGFYRNIYVEELAVDNLTEGVERLVLFTAAAVYSDGGLAWTSGSARSSTAERSGSFNVISRLSLENGTLLAFGDLTLLMEPFCYVEDNYRLLVNLVDLISRVRPPVVEVEVEVEEIGEPRLPVGTEKLYLEVVDGEETEVRWLKASEREVWVERRNVTTVYRYDEEGGLLGWETEGANATYEPAIPKPPYPLRRGKGWSYWSNYTLRQDGRLYSGVYRGEEWVDDIERVEAEDERSYLCAEVRFELRVEIGVDGGNWTYTYSGSSWLSSEVGLVREEGVRRLYIDGEFFQEERRTWILKSVKWG